MKTISFRLKPVEFLKEEIEKRAQDINAGVLLSMVGSLENAVMRMAGAASSEEGVKNFAGPFEIVSGTGTISKNGSHIHISVADKEGKVFGGHLKEGTKVN